MFALPWKHLYFAGCGGVGMAGLAHICADAGVLISGSDAVNSSLLVSLQQRGCRIQVGHARELPPGVDLLVYSAAVPADNPERQDAARRGIPSCCRGEFLARLAAFYPRVAAVAGSHGKTTTTAMLAHIALQAGINPGYLVGGEVSGWLHSAGAGTGELLITEVDESDGTQALLAATHAVILNIEDDHCWSLGGVEALEQCFVTFARQAGKVFAWQEGNAPRLLAELPQALLLPPEVHPQLTDLPLPGLHNRRNATMALRVAEELGISTQQAVTALQNFPGVSRRLSVRWQSPSGERVLVEDYAHHPTELRATLAALQERWPRHQLWVLFQPHRYERVKRYAPDFALILGGVQRVWLVAPFAAWKDDCQLADPEDITRAINLAKPGLAQYISTGVQQIPELVLPVLAESRGKILLAVIGAGDIGKAAGLLAAALQDSSRAIESSGSTSSSRG
jgi:UDP-N-acetylmuramate--alanine ligase